MQLTGEQIVSRRIIENVVPEAIQQQGVDVRIKSIDRVGGDGYIPAEGKTRRCPTTSISFDENGQVVLEPGWYDVTLEEKCEIPSNAVLNYKTRSSLVRCGATVYSGQFDGGFKTDNMGCFLEVRLPITVEKGTRIAQAVVTESYEVAADKLYNGQWQGDNQRASK